MNEIKPGNYVRINGQETIGEVIAVKGNDLEIAVGQLKVTVRKNKVSLVPKPEEARVHETLTNASVIDTKSKLMNFRFELDVRGKMKEEVITELTPWVDDAILLGIPEARIVHGRGNGILKTTVRSFLRKYTQVESLTDEAQEKGGDYVTIVKFKV